MLRDALFTLDRGVSARTGSLLTDRPALVTLLFHKVFVDKAEVAKELVSPSEGATLGDYRQLFDYFLGLRYRFVSVDQVLAGLDPDHNHILLSFDDGYANNRRILTLLKEYNVPATFFIATGFVGSEKAFWWDAVYRARVRRGTWLTYPHRRRRALHARLRTEAEEHVRQEYGADALTSMGELDRPLDEDELRAFADEDLVTIGNHTIDHALLTTLSPEAAHAQISGAQDFLERVTGTRPRAIAYPYGDTSPAVIKIAQVNGLELGLTCDAHRNSLPLARSNMLSLGRFEVTADDLFLKRCNECRLDVSFSRIARSAARRFR